MPERRILEEINSKNFGFYSHLKDTMLIPRARLTYAELRERPDNYSFLDINGKAIASLGMNSILDLSFNYHDAQTRFYGRQQWKQLRTRFPTKKYGVKEYAHLSTPLETIGQKCNSKKSFEANWLSIYKEAKRLHKEHDPVLNEEHRDVNFCTESLLQVLSIIKNQPHLFDNEVDSSEWDFVVKFWGVVTERLFQGIGLFGYE